MKEGRGKEEGKRRNYVSPLKIPGGSSSNLLGAIILMQLDEFLRENNIWHRFKESQQSTRSAREASDNAGVPFNSIIKTLVFETTDEVFLVIAKAENKVSTKKLKKLLSISDTRLASPEKVKEATGYEAGAVPPIAHRQKLRVVLDEKVLDIEKAWAGGGLTSRIIELKIEDVLRFTEPLIADVAD